jgi:NAD(P)-dependent dehydrogenase (short-subunit alcohol dehydrogenase family)
MGSLDGRRILITGVSRGVGLETARLFLGEGAEIVGIARDPERLARARTELDPEGRRLSVLAADLTDPEAPRRVRAAVEARFAALDVLFNNAAVQIDGDTQGIDEGSESVLERAMAANLIAPYRLCRILVPLLLRGAEPRIVNVSSGAGTLESMSALGIPTYRLSKWALNGYTMLLSAELRGKVAVNAFDPGWVRTDLGGPRAPGTPADSAKGALSLVTLPFAETGGFWKDGSRIAF